MMGMPGALRARGVSTLVVDNPGVGESLRLHGLHNFPEAEVPAAAAVDFLATLPDVDADRVGIMALSLGGYHAPRAAAFEKRFKCCVAWGANYDWGATQRARHQSGTTQPADPALLGSRRAGCSASKTVEEILAVSEKLCLKGVLDRIACPILVVHGENDRQIPLSRPSRRCASAPPAPRRSFTCTGSPTAAPSIAASTTSHSPSR